MDRFDQGCFLSVFNAGKSKIDRKYLDFQVYANLWMGIFWWNIMEDVKKTRIFNGQANCNFDPIFSFIKW